VVVVNDIIDFQRLEAGDMRVDRNTFVLQDIVMELVTLFRSSLKKDGVEFDVEMSIDRSAFGDGSRLLLLGDDSKIRRIAINLLLNVLTPAPTAKIVSNH
jgi:signal transduction histidine kinase